MGKPLLKPWRYYRTPPAAGPWNMALDAALMEGAGQPGFRPFFRFYEWRPSCISLGRFQNLSTGLAPDALHRWDHVRRVTGGGAILHQGELTYSMGFRVDDWPSELGRLSYEQICQFLLATWRSFGWEAEFAKDVSERDGVLGTVTPACFSGKEKHDILVDGRKLGGNAQRRDRGWVFQHGSIPLRLDWAALEAVFAPGFRPEPAQTTDLVTLGFHGSSEDLIATMLPLAELHLGAAFQSQVVDGELLERTRFWEQTRFANQEWTKGNAALLRG